MTTESDNIAALKKLLACENLPQNPDKYSDYFDEIAKILMNKCVISKCGTKYEIVEIEFYLYSPSHQDVITYPREIKPGQWFFHQSGVDLTFESNGNQFGGILIRGLRKISDDKLILGPLKCVEKLWDKSDAFELNVEDYPIITTESTEIHEKELTKYPRHIPRYGKEPNIKIKGWTARIPSNFTVTTSTEDIAKLVFDSKYRFFKIGSIDQSDETWKKYTGNPKRN